MQKTISRQQVRRELFDSIFQRLPGFIISKQTGFRIAAANGPGKPERRAERRRAARAHAVGQYRKIYGR